MRLIGLTGGIATGKSTVARILAARGAVLVDADELAREVVQPGMPALTEIAERFGASVIAPDGALDRTTLGGIVFADAEARRDLERITHPRITELMQQRVAAAAERGAGLVVVDIPLLFENNRESLFEGVLLVYAPEAVQIARLQARDGIDEPAARLRLAAQMPIEAKRHRATWVIDNAGSPSETDEQVARWWKDVIAGDA